MVEGTHDATQITKQLRQVLVAPKLSTGFFIGAGCPASIKVSDGKGGTKPLIPDVKGLTGMVTELLVGSDQKGAFGKLSDVLLEDGLIAANVEVLLSRIRSLHDVAGNGVARGLTAAELLKLDVAICRTITEVVTCDLPIEANGFDAIATLVAGRRAPVSEIFTTNYDLLMEQAFERGSVPYFDGFVGCVKPFFDQRAIEDDVIPARWARLWKLHGSINWRSNKKTKSIYRSGFPDR